MTRKQLESRANKIGLTITGDHESGYSIDSLDADYLDRRSQPYRTLTELEEGIAFREMQAESAE